MINLLELYPRANSLLAEKGTEKCKYKRLDTAKLLPELRRFDNCVRNTLYSMLWTASDAVGRMELNKNPLLVSLKFAELNRIVEYGIIISSATKKFEDSRKWDTRCENQLK